MGLPFAFPATQIHSLAVQIEVKNRDRASLMVRESVLAEGYVHVSDLGGL